MLKWLLRKQITAFERAYDYDMSYARELLETDPGAFLALSKMMALGRYRKNAPRDAISAAALVATMVEDCGPCTQLVVTMAEREGTPTHVLRAVVAGEIDKMPDDVALAFQFAQATLAHDPTADELRSQIVTRWGKRGLVSLTFAVTSGRLFPTLKYALGHGHTCTRVNIAGTSTVVHHPQVV